jgi:4,4'-diaponeurosporenoate glycosyltransferase
MYPDGFSQLRDGWSKNLASGAAAVDPVAVAGTVLWIGAGLAAAGSTARGCLRFVRRQDAFPTAALLGYALFALQTQVILRKIGSFRAWTAFAYPVPLAAFVALFARSVILTHIRREVRWRGRPVPIRTRPRGRR